MYPFFRCYLPTLIFIVLCTLSQNALSLPSSGIEGIEHRNVSVNGITMHIAETGRRSNTVVLLLHGFPELWYTWRHQLTALAASGYHAVAPDLRGYGETTSPAPIGPSNFTTLHIVGDLVALINMVSNGSKCYLVGHDWGAQIGWSLSMYRTDLVKAFVSLSVPFSPRNPAVKPVAGLRSLYGDDYYICRFQKAGEIEAKIQEYGVAATLAAILASRKPGAPILPKDNPFGVNKSQSETLPAWLSQKDLEYYARKFSTTGFTGALNYYRALDLNWELTAPWTGPKVILPVLYIAGEFDSFYTTPSIKQYIERGGFKRDVPLVKTVIMKGAAHFINEERPEEINNYILNYFKRFP